ncbi:MAG: carboxymuconolactone decarboxylase family protein [Erythrobacter sp.]
MAHIDPLKLDEMPENLQSAMDMASNLMGFLPNSLPTMAHWPELIGGFAPMAATILRTGELSIGLKQMIAAVVSGAAGCRYCQAHTSHVAAHAGGIDAEKIARVWEFQNCDLFNDAECAALELALAAGQVPNASNQSHFDRLKQFYSDREIVEIVAVISLFGFLNRWNDTMATELEAEPLEFAQQNFAAAHWDIGKHGA